MPLKRMGDDGKGKCYMKPSKGDGVVDIARIGGCPQIMYVRVKSLLSAKIYFITYRNMYA
jgi:hypothetical protein